MSVKYKFGNQDKLYFVTFAVVNWIDLFIRNEYKDIVLNSWRYCTANKGLEVYGWCIMTSHVHMIIGSHGDKLADIVRDMKKHTSTTLKQAIKSHPAESRKEWMLWMMERSGKKNGQNLNFQLWQQDNHPIELYDLSIAHQKLNYIHNNPVTAGIVDTPEAYLYSCARNYLGTADLLDIDLLDPLLM